MRVVLDAYWWARGTQSLQNVLHGVVDAWLETFPEDDVTVVVPRRDVDGVSADLPRARVVGTRLWPHGLSAMLAVPFVARRRRAQVVLTHNFAALFGANTGVLIQDLMFETNPEWFTRKELLYYRWMTRVAARADVVFSSTDTEGRRIDAHVGDVRVVTAGMGMAEDLVGATASSEPVPEIEPNHYVLAVGRLNVRKNLATTIEGALKSGMVTREFPLMIVGERDGAFEALPASVRLAEEQGEVRFTGFVRTEQLRWLIENCAAYVCLSLDEGFGLPPVEAALLGARVVASDIPVFRETLQSSAAFVDPRSVDAIAAALERVLTSPSSDGPDYLLAERHRWENVVRRIRSELSPGAQ